MGRNDDNGPALPPKIRAAFDFLHHTRLITEQVDSAIPMRGLTALEKSVEAAALRAVQQYLLGEMDFTDEPVESSPERKGGEDGPAAETVNSDY